MIFGQDRDELRQMYFDAWRKSVAGEILSPLEAQIAAVITDHPEYHLAMTATSVDEAFLPEDGETNPFLHMGLHLAIREQVATNRPAGITTVFAALRSRHGDTHSAEHQALECLAETLWEAQNNNALPDESTYLERLRRL